MCLARGLRPPPWRPNRQGATSIAHLGLVYINRQALQLPQFLPAVAMQYHCQAVASLSILQFEFDFIARNDSTARFTATMSAGNGPQPFESGFRQAATSQ
jgi:hypothetical protein